MKILELPDQKKRFIISAIVLLAVALERTEVFMANRVIAQVGQTSIDALPNWEKLLILAGPPLLIYGLALGLLSSFSREVATDMLGLNKGLGLPLLAAVIATLPMFIGCGIVNGLAENLHVKQILFNNVYAGFNEELIYRAFITGILVRYARWNFLVAAVLSCFIWAWEHLYQAGNISEQVMILLFMTGSGLGLSAGYKFWNWNIWFVIFMHTLMNMTGSLFPEGHNLLMSWTGNVFRGITILLAVFISVYYWRKKGIKTTAN